MLHCWGEMQERDGQCRQALKDVWGQAGPRRLDWVWVGVEGMPLPLGLQLRLDG